MDSSWERKKGTSYVGFEFPTTAKMSIICFRVVTSCACHNPEEQHRQERRSLVGIRHLKGGSIKLIGSYFLWR
jgi:hypothetical protein